MSPLTLFCPGGSDSQSGEAAKKRYPKAKLATCGNVIADVPKFFETNAGPCVIPIWNSHHGEIGAANFVWNQVEDAKIKLLDLWAKSIEFWFVRRIGVKTLCGKIGSVPVAASQCSGFLKKQNAELKPYSLTTVAFTEYRNGAELDGVLVAPGQGKNETGYEVLFTQTANPNNFTSFVTLAPSRMKVKRTKSIVCLTGVTMRPLDVSLKDAEQTFFSGLLDAAKDMRDIPKLIFVLKRTAKVGLLFEGPRLYRSDLLDAEEMEKGDVLVHEDAGAIRNSYAVELHKLFKKEFTTLHTDDFILHCGAGNDTCLFACPPLDLYTHGYEIKTVDPVVRFYISRLFQRWNQGELACTADQTSFFQRHKVAWQKEGPKFIKFKRISAE
jgi:prephenate dehydratase